jgi:predicted Zn-ribbon and HTH transcriptional regulator
MRLKQPTIIYAADKQGNTYIIGITCAACGHHFNPRKQTGDGPKVCPKCRNDWRRPLKKGRSIRG